jgi:hypothetical protein
VTRPLATLAALVGALLGPLALSAPTAWLLIPVHAVFSAMVGLGAALDGWAGRPERARLWGFGYLVASALMVGGLQLGADTRSAGMAYWGGPWLAVLLWGWIPPLLAGGAGWVGGYRERRLVRRAVRARQAAVASSSGSSPPSASSARRSS